MRFIYKGRTYDYDEDDLSFDEAIEFEKHAGATIPDLQTGQAPRGSQVIKAMVWSAMHREDPTVKIGDLGDLKYKQFEFLPPEDEPDGDEPAGPSAPPDPPAAVELPAKTPPRRPQSGRAPGSRTKGAATRTSSTPSSD